MKPLIAGMAWLSVVGMVMGCAVLDKKTANGGQAKITDAELVNTYWQLSELNGKPAELGVGKKALHMVLTLEKNQVGGFAGCNRFSGTYQKKEDQLKFGPMAATMMACVEGMEQEQVFLKALGQTERYTIKGHDLALYSNEEKPILRFKAVYLE